MPYFMMLTVHANDLEVKSAHDTTISPLLVVLKRVLDPPVMLPRL